MKALVVEDETQTIEAISLIFKLRWPEVELLFTTRGLEVAPMVEKESPDVVILDLGLPDVDGIEVLKEIRAFSDVPIIILTARYDSISHIKGLELGADDYITKPFDPGVLLVRIKNTLAHTRTLLNQATDTFAAGSLAIDFASRHASLYGKSLNLTSTEYKLLCHLARNVGRVLSHDNICKTVLGEEYAGELAMLKSHIYNLRRKLTQVGANSQIITSERGIGYKFIIPQ